MTRKEREEAIKTIERLDDDFGDYEPNHKVFENILSALKGFEGMTNGEVMQAVYADSEIEIDEAWKTVTVYLGADGDYCEDEVKFDLDWWNAPYKAESEGTE